MPLIEPGIDTVFAGGSATIKSINLPDNVLEQLKQLGFSLSSYTRGELEDAVAACAYDGRLKDDPNAVTFRDGLHYSQHEKDEDEGITDINPYRGQPIRKQPLHKTFCERIKAERNILQGKEEEHCPYYGN